MKRVLISIGLAAAVATSGFAAGRREKVPQLCGKWTQINPSAQLRAEMEKYGFSACEYSDGTNVFSGLFRSPKACGVKKFPLIVYIPGSGEKGRDLMRQFRQPTVFAKVCDAKFSKENPCHLLAVSPPDSATTLVGGLPGRPNALQRLLHDFIVETIRRTHRPDIDPDRIYLTGFSYGGSGVYALAQHYPGEYAAVVPISSLPPLREYFSETHPGNWWHFNNEGDYSRHGMPTEELEWFRDRTNAAGGDFRIGTFPADSHDAWSAVWGEEEMWKWMFSKSLKTSGTRRFSLVGAKCTASIAGWDAGCGPERVIDGLDDTAYTPARPFRKDDWWMVELPAPVCGKVNIYSGNREREALLKHAQAEVSLDGRKWVRAGQFSSKDGVCSFVRRNKFKFVRIKSTSSAPSLFTLRRMDVSAGAI